MFRSLRTALLIGSLMIASSYDGGGTDPCQGRDGVVPHPDDCSSYFICTNETSELLNCSEDLSFNRLKRTCDYSQFVDCDADAPDDNVSGDRESAGDDTCRSVTSTWVSGVSSSCSEYYRCENGKAYRDSCAEGLLFNSDTLACDHSKNVVCDDKSLETNPEDTTQSTMSNINTYGSTTSSLRSTFSNSEESTTGTKNLLVTFSIEPESNKTSETINHTSELTESTPLDDDRTTEVPKVSSSFESTLPSKASNPLPELPTEASDPNRNTESTSATAQTTESKTERPKAEETRSTEQKTSTTMHDKRDPVTTEQTKSEFATMELSSHQGQTSTKQPTSNVSPGAIYSTIELEIFNQITDDEKDDPFVQEPTTASDQIDGGTNNPSDSTGVEANNSSHTSTEETRHPSVTTEVGTSTASQTTAGDSSTTSQTTSRDISTASQTTAGDTSTAFQSTAGDASTASQTTAGDASTASQTTAGNTTAFHTKDEGISAPVDDILTTTKEYETSAPTKEESTIRELTSNKHGSTEMNKGLEISTIGQTASTERSTRQAGSTMSSTAGDASDTSTSSIMDPFLTVSNERKTEEPELNTFDHTTRSPIPMTKAEQTTNTFEVNASKMVTETTGASESSPAAITQTTGASESSPTAAVQTTGASESSPSTVTQTTDASESSPSMVTQMTGASESNPTTAAQTTSASKSSPTTVAQADGASEPTVTTVQTVIETTVTFSPITSEKLATKFEYNTNEQTTTSKQITTDSTSTEDFRTLSTSDLDPTTTFLPTADADSSTVDQTISDGASSSLQPTDHYAKNTVSTQTDKYSEPNSTVSYSTSTEKSTIENTEITPYSTKMESSTSEQTEEASTEISTTLPTLKTNSFTGVQTTYEVTSEISEIPTEDNQETATDPSSEMFELSSSTTSRTEAFIPSTTSSSTRSAVPINTVKFTTNRKSTASTTDLIENTSEQSTSIKPGTKEDETSTIYTITGDVPTTFKTTETENTSLKTSTAPELTDVTDQSTGVSKTSTTVMQTSANNEARTTAAITRSDDTTVENSSSDQSTARMTATEKFEATMANTASEITTPEHITSTDRMTRDIASSFDTTVEASLSIKDNEKEISSTTQATSTFKIPLTSSQTTVATEAPFTTQQTTGASKKASTTGDSEPALTTIQTADASESASTTIQTTGASESASTTIQTTGASDQTSTTAHITSASDQTSTTEQFTGASERTSTTVKTTDAYEPTSTVVPSTMPTTSEISSTTLQTTTIFKPSTAELSSNTEVSSTTGFRDSSIAETSGYSELSRPEGTTGGTEMSNLNIESSTAEITSSSGRITKSEDSSTFSKTTEEIPITHKDTETESPTTVQKKEISTPNTITIQITTISDSNTPSIPITGTDESSLAEFITESESSEITSTPQPATETTLASESSTSEKTLETTASVTKAQGSTTDRITTPERTSREDTDPTVLTTEEISSTDKITATEDATSVQTSSLENSSEDETTVSEASSSTLTSETNLLTTPSAVKIQTSNSLLTSANDLPFIITKATSDTPNLTSDEEQVSSISDTDFISSFSPETESASSDTFVPISVSTTETLPTDSSSGAPVYPSTGDSFATDPTLQTPLSTLKTFETTQSVPEGITVERITTPEKTRADTDYSTILTKAEDYSTTEQPNTSCSCGKCRVQDPEDCTRYSECVNDEYVSKQCDVGYLFSSTLGGCAMAEIVECDHHSEQCLKGDGFFADENDCSSYVQCYHGISYKRTCPKGLFYNPVKRTCDTHSNCGAKPVLPTSRSLEVDCDCDYCIMGDSEDCIKYYLCLDGVAYDETCSDGLLFNSETATCDYEGSATCASPSPQCSTKNGDFSVPGNCSSYHHCVGGVAYDKECAPGFHFSESSRQCEEACEAGCDPSIECPATSELPLCLDQDDFFPNPEDCHTFYECSEGEAKLAECTDGEHFNAVEQICQDPCEAMCDPDLECFNSTSASTDSGTPAITESATSSISSLITSEETKISDPTDVTSTNVVSTSRRQSAATEGTSDEISTDLYSSVHPETSEVTKISDSTDFTSTNVAPTSRRESAATEESSSSDDIPTDFYSSVHPETGTDELITESTSRITRYITSSDLFSDETTEPSPTTYSALCPEPTGVYPDPEECRALYLCIDGYPMKLYCDDHLHFDPLTKRCESPCSASCDPTLDCSTTEEPETPTPLPLSLCRTKDFLPNREFCKYYYDCTHGRLRKKQKCPKGLQFNPTRRVCDLPQKSGCGEPSKDLPVPDLYYKCPCEACLVPSAHNCLEYFLCLNFTAYRMKCSDGLLFDKKQNTCNLANKVICDSSTTTTNTPYPTTEETYTTTTGHPYTTEAPQTTKSYTTSQPYTTTRQPYTTSTTRKSYTTSSTTTSRPYTTSTTREPYRTSTSTTRKPYTTSSTTTSRPYTTSTTREPYTTSTSTTREAYSTLTSTTSRPHTTSTTKSPYTTSAPTSGPYTTSAPTSRPYTTSTTTSRPYTTSTTSKPRSTLSPTKGPVRCPEANGMFRNAKDCSSFIHCSNFMPYLKECPGGLHFSVETQRCEYPCDAKCDELLPCVSSSTVSSTTPNPLCTCRNCLRPNPESCTKFFECKNGQPTKRDCPRGQTFDARRSKCDWAHRVDCQHSEICPKRNGLFPYKGDCNKFVHCSNGIPYTKVCPPRLQFDPATLRCTFAPGPCVSVPSLNGTKSKSRPPVPGVPQWHCPGSFGYYRHEEKCNQYYHCTEGVPTLKECPESLYFNSKSGTCDWPKDVNCRASQNHLERRCRRFTEVFRCPANRSYVAATPHCDMFFDCRTGKACAKRCPDGLYFNPETSMCDLPTNVKCRKSEGGSYSLKRFAEICRHGYKQQAVDPATSKCYYKCHHDKVRRYCCSGTRTYNEKRGRCERRTAFYLPFE